jgi:hypothetical protein
LIRFTRGAAGLQPWKTGEPIDFAQKSGWNSWFV